MAGDNKSKYLRDAEKYVLQGRMPQAIAEYLKIIKKDPDDVLTLNTIGDLYLRQGKITEATAYFSKVADNYARNNFLLKAIAVYKKILNADSGNLDVTLTLASLYAKQGQNVEARNLYLRVADHCAKAGKNRETREAYEKVVELDPQNYGVQLKLAEIHMAEGAKEKAQINFAGAARAQVKAGELRGALASFKRAMQIDPLEIEVMKGFLDASLQSGDVTAALDQLKVSLAMAPDQVALHEMLGRACLANKDPEQALKAFQFVRSKDESRYEDFIAVSNAFLDLGDYDQAAVCLDTVIPILIARRETEKAIGAYTLILNSDPTHILTLTKMAGLYSATNDQARYLDVLDRIAGCYLSLQCPREALEYLDKILVMAPTSEKHLKLHREAFAEAYPGSPYAPPVVTSETSREAVSVGTAVPVHRDSESAAAESSNPATVEVDLLLNYGMRDKALALLQSMVAQDPADKEIRTRLLNIYREDPDHAKATEQCLLLAALHRRVENEGAALKYIAEARRLSPDLVTPEFDLVAFARKHGLAVEFAEPEKASPGIEVDLSGDLSEMFFQESNEPETVAEGEAPEVEPAAAEFMPEIPPKPPSESVQEQLQEVDFYIRLGFLDEARTKLDEIARNYPHNPELPLRYRQLKEAAASAQTTPSQPGASVPIESTSSGDNDGALGLQAERALEGLGGELEEAHPGVQVETLASKTGAAPPRVQADSGTVATVPQPAPAGTRAENEDSVNTMFADLLEEVNDLTDQEIAREEFDTHFSLGIAYREMELTEDAIKEFQNAYKALNPEKYPKEAIQCCGMLSTCFLEKGMPRSALRWCQAGLGVSGISSHEDLALRYDMGIAHSILGDCDRALACFDHIYAIEPGYRDVAQKIDSLRGGSDRHVP